ncbi:ferrochelatase [Alteromonadaceae bacterium BrNp21-10]|nr:ferrochelatase [Alteromonadaceae bacterium BrNp21-10]
MKYIGNKIDHKQQNKIGVLLVNLGTPDAPTKPALKRYLKEFLSDPRIVELPRWLWWCILNLVILNFRPALSAKTYQEVWTEKGSPLLFHLNEQRDKLREAFADNSNVVVECAMRYGSPSIADVLLTMQQQGVGKLLVLPMYPQYCAATTGSTFDAIASQFCQQRWFPELRFINQYFDDAGYIDAMCQQIEDHWQEHGRSQKLLFSYHGIPQAFVDKGDPYQLQCLQTSKRIALQLGIAESQYITTFQSRFGKEQWLTPYTDMTLKQLAQEQIKSVQVVCPGFSADCIETIEEIGIENRDYFLQGGGESFQYIPALNGTPTHISALKTLVAKHISHW